MEPLPPQARAGAEDLSSTQIPLPWGRREEGDSPPPRVSWDLPAMPVRLLAQQRVCWCPAGAGPGQGNKHPVPPATHVPPWPRPRRLLCSAGLGPPQLTPGGGGGSGLSEVGFAGYIVFFPLPPVTLEPCRAWPSPKAGLSMQLVRLEEASWQLEQVMPGLRCRRQALVR